LLCTIYEEMADEVGALVAVSETTVTSFRANLALNTPGPTLVVMVACDTEPY
jgi:hypothetical protein